MADSKIVMEYEVRQNKIKDSKGYGKWYAQPVNRGTLSMKGFARHLHEHNGTYKTSVIKGVMEEMVECLVEFLSQGVGVKLDGLGTLRATFECKGADSAGEFNVTENLKGIHIRLFPEGVKDEELTSRKFMSKCILRKQELKSNTTAEDGGGSTDSGSQGGSPDIDDLP